MKKKWTRKYTRVFKWTLPSLRGSRNGNVWNLGSRLRVIKKITVRNKGETADEKSSNKQLHHTYSFVGNGGKKTRKWTRNWGLGNKTGHRIITMRCVNLHCVLF